MSPSSAIHALHLPSRSPSLGVSVRRRWNCDDWSHPIDRAPWPPPTMSLPRTDSGRAGQSCRGTSGAPATAVAGRRTGTPRHRPLPRTTQPRHSNNRSRHGTPSDRPASPPPATRPTRRATDCDCQVPAQSCPLQRPLTQIDALSGRYATTPEASISFRCGPAC